MKPSSLHDPIQDIAPSHAASFPFNSHIDLRLMLIACLAVLLFALVIRLRRTAPLDPEWGPRADMMRLIAVICGGLLFEWVRARFDLATPGFWIASVALLPFVVGTVVLSVRLLQAYRQTKISSTNLAGTMLDSSDAASRSAATNAAAKISSTRSGRSSK